MTVIPAENFGQLTNINPAIPAQRLKHATRTNLKTAIQIKQIKFRAILSKISGKAHKALILKSYIITTIYFFSVPITVTMALNRG